MILSTHAITAHKPRQHPYENTTEDTHDRTEFTANNYPSGDLDRGVDMKVNTRTSIANVMAVRPHCYHFCCTSFCFLGSIFPSSNFPRRRYHCAPDIGRLPSQLVSYKSTSSKYLHTRFALFIQVLIQGMMVICVGCYPGVCSNL